jgi:hypothetical protein
MECRSAGARALAVPTDVSREDEVKRLALGARATRRTRKSSAETGW